MDPEAIIGLIRLLFSSWASRLSRLAVLPPCRHPTNHAASASASASTFASARYMMSSSSVNEGTWSGLTFKNKRCNYGKRATMRISESISNKHKLYYNCEDTTRDFFSWYYPTNDVPLIMKARPAKLEDDMKDIKHLLEKLNVLLLFVCLLFVILLGLLVQRK